MMKGYLSFMPNPIPPEPPFVPREGQIDYTHEHRAPVLNCVITCRGKLLLVQRNPTMRLYPGVWNGVSGFLDEPGKSLEEKVREELREELGVADDAILSIREAPDTIEVASPEYDKLWIVHPVHVEIATPNVTLDWEAVDHVWVDPEEARTYDLMPGFEKLLDLFAL